MNKVHYAHSHVKYSFPPLSDLLTDLKRKSQRELAGPCPFYGGNDRFIVFENGRGWCRQCSWNGDSVQLLRDRDGLSFREACERLGIHLSRENRRQARVHSIALARAKKTYRNWKRQRLIEMTDQHRLLFAEKLAAETAYRQIHQHPGWYNQEEQRFWTFKLASLYDQIATLEHDLDILTYRENEEASFQWCQEEARRG